MVKKVKKVVGIIKLQIPACKANPAPPVGPALGQKGLNIMEFCKSFNEATKNMEEGMPLPVVITAYADRSFAFEIKTPPVSYFLLKFADIDKGSPNPGRDIVGEITWDKIREIAEKKMSDLNAYDIDSASTMVAGSAFSMGLKIVGDQNE
jgi:large subunit ribosomal protein L11